MHERRWRPMARAATSATWGRGEFGALRFLNQPLRLSQALCAGGDQSGETGQIDVRQAWFCNPNGVNRCSLGDRLSKFLHPPARGRRAKPSVGGEFRLG